MKKLLLLFLSISLVITLVACGGKGTQSTDTKPVSGSTGTDSNSTTTTTGEESKLGYGDDTSIKANLLIWTWDQAALESSANTFRETYPNVTFEFIAVSSTDYLKKVQTAFAANDRLPDVLSADGTWRGKLYNLGVCAYLDKDPINYDISNLYEYTLPLSYDDKGNLVGIQQLLSPGCLAYRADIAEKWLGTSDRKELEAMMPDWDSFIEKGKEVYEASNGTVKMLPGLDEAYLIMSNQNDAPFVKDGALNLEESIGEAIKYLAQMRDLGIVDKLSQWSPSWTSAYSDGSVIFFAATTWSIRFCIQANDPEGSEAGLWRLMNTPGGGWNYQGGSTCLWKDSPYLEAAWAYVRNGTSIERCEARKEIYWLQNNTKAYLNPEYPSLMSIKCPPLGGQDIAEFFIGEVAKNTLTRRVSSYDTVIDDAVKYVYQQMITDTSIGYEKAMELIKDEIYSQMPELK